ncbi:hypothetical protein, partial [Escherichia coli]
MGIKVQRLSLWMIN